MSQISLADTSVKINPLCCSVYTAEEFWLNQNLSINCTVLYTRYRKYLLSIKHLNIDYKGTTFKLAGVDLLQNTFRKRKNRKRKCHPGAFLRVELLRFKSLL